LPAESRGERLKDNRWFTNDGANEDPKAFFRRDGFQCCGGADTLGVLSFKLGEWTQRQASLAVGGESARQDLNLKPRAPKARARPD
jgi:hypothetical protein